MFRNSLVVLALASLGSATAAQASVAPYAAVEGTLSASGGGAAADGNYSVAFALLEGPGGKVVWTETEAALAVKGGQFQYTLGSKTPLSAGLFSGDRWLQLQIGTDPPLQAMPLRSVALALRAAVAEAVECTGCIKAGQLDSAVTQGFVKSSELQGYAKTTDLGGYAKQADLSGYAKLADLTGYAKASDLSDYVKATSLAKVAGTGNYADLTGKPSLATVATSGSYADLANKPALPKLGETCGTGLVMKGVKADGSYECVAGGVDPASLPKDGLDEISNGLLTNQFGELASSPKTPLDITDGFAAGIADEIVVPDWGVAQGVSVAVELTNSDISQVRVTVYDPKGNKYALHEQSGSGTSLKTSYPDVTKPVSGDFAVWIGGNPQGKWSISVADLAGTSGGKDGKLVSWAVKVKALSSQKVAATKGFQLANLDTPPVPCNAATFGMMFASPKDKSFYMCNGTEYVAFTLVNPGTVENPAASCKEVLTKFPAAKDGLYWLKSGNAAIQAWCDMTTAGGGWTQIVRCSPSDNCAPAGKFLYVQDWLTADVANATAGGSYILGKSLLSTVNGSNEFLVSITDTGSKATGHMQMPLNPGTVGFFSSTGQFQSDMTAWKRIDSNGSVATYTSRFCYAPTNTYRVRTFMGLSGLTLLGKTSEGPSSTQAGSTCDYGPWGAQMLIRDYDNGITSVFGSSPVNQWKQQPYEHRVLVR